MAKIIAKLGSAVRIVGDKIGLYPSCCCGCCEYGAIFPINFRAVGTSIEGNPFDVSGTATDNFWQDEAGNTLSIGPCTEIPDTTDYPNTTPGFSVVFTPAGSQYQLGGGIVTQYIENWPCDQIKNIVGMTAFLAGAFYVQVGTVEFSEPAP